MLADILNHQPAGPSTILPGTWLVYLPQNFAIHVRRYRPRVSTAAAGNGTSSEGQVKDDPLENAWRGINTSPGISVRNVLRDPCAIICSSGDLEGAGLKDVKGRELWLFYVKDASDTEDAFGGSLDGSDELEIVEHHFSPVEPAHLLNCPRHGHDLSCLLRPSTSQRPLKSCDVRFEPHGEVKVVWERLGQAIVEKLQWNRGKRIFVRRAKRLRIDLHPTPTGLQVRTRTFSPKDDRHRRLKTTERHTDSILEPLGLCAILLSPHATTQSEGETLGASFESVLGPGFKDGQMACRTQAQLDHRFYHPYSVLWVPTPGATSTGEASSPGATSTTEAIKDDQGVLTIWPTHLITDSRKRRVPATNSNLPTPLNPLEDHLGLMAAASSLFDIASAYKEPEADNTPSSDRSIEEEEEEATIPDPQEANTPNSQSSPAQAPGSDAEDDLENLFASDTPPRTPELFESEKAFEMFGEQSSRRISNGNNANLIDYGDVVMSSPPAEEERRPSVLQIMGGSEVPEEADAAFVTEDDFNFFDSPPDEVVPEIVAAPVEHIKEADDQPVTTVEAAENVDAPEKSSPAEPTSVQVVSPLDVTEVANETDRLDPTSPKEVQPAVEQATLGDQVIPAPPRSFPTPASSTSISEHRIPSNRSLVPSAFEPLDLPNPGTTFAYSLPSPAPTPQNLNADLIERLSSPRTTKKVYEYAAAWLLDSPPSEADEDEYTGPPTPISEIDDYDESTATPMPVVPAKVGSGVLEYDGMPCVTTEWFGMIDDLARTQALSRSWVKTWTIRNTDAGPVSTEKNTSKKRKRTSDDDKPGGQLDLTALARQVICNRELRHQLIKRSASILHDTDPQSTDLGTIGTSLVDFAPPSTDEDSLEAVDEESSVGGTFTQCDIHLGFRGNVMRMSIASLRYWRELDLQPLGGEKDVKVIALVEDLNDVDIAKQICARLGDTYKMLGLGGYELDTSFGDGGLQSTSGKKQPLSQAIQWISKQEGNAAILFLCTSITSASLQVYLDQTSMAGLSPTQIVHFVPLSTLVQRDVHDVARCIYDRFPRQLRRVDHVNQGEAPWYHYPSFTLSPEDPPKPHLTLAWPIKSLDIFGSWRWIHTAYAWSQDRQSLIIVISDAEGENWGVKVVPLGQGPKPQAKVKAVWDTAIAFGNTASIEYRVSVCHLGIMSPKEIEAWRQLFTMAPTPMSIMMSEPALHSSGPSPPRNGPSNVVPGLLNDPSSSIIDDSLAGSYYTLPQRQPVILKDSTCYYPDSTFLLSLATPAPAMQYETSTMHVLCHKSVPGKEEDEVAESVLAKEMYRMSCWSRLKFGLEGLPGHLAAVRAVQEAFALDDE